jgi:hypothetical protein
LESFCFVGWLFYIRMPFLPSVHQSPLMTRMKTARFQMLTYSAEIV